jgi:hypothetical protein
VAQIPASVTGTLAVLCCAPAPLFGAEIDAVWEARDRGEVPVTSPRDSVATMRSLDRWRLGVEVR